MVVLPVGLLFTYPSYSWGLGPYAWNVLGVGPVLVGFGLVVAAVREHLKSSGRRKRLDSAVRYFLQAGPYRYTRNPMYLAAAMFWLGWAMLFGSPYLLAGMILLLALISVVAIPFEEKRNEVSFGDAYRIYMETVPRWLGRRKKTQSTSDVKGPQEEPRDTAGHA